MQSTLRRVYDNSSEVLKELFDDDIVSKYIHEEKKESPIKKKEVSSNFDMGVGLLSSGIINMPGTAKKKEDRRQSELMDFLKRQMKGDMGSEDEDSAISEESEQSDSDSGS